MISKIILPAPTTLLQDIDTMPGVVASSRRIMVNAMINSAEKGSGVKLYGVEPRLNRMSPIFMIKLSKAITSTV